MARASWVGPLLAFAINFLLLAGGNQEKPGSTNLVGALIGTLLIGGGLVLGTIALFGISKFGRKSILIPALVGLTINLFLIAMAAWPLLYTRQRVRLLAAVHTPSAGLLNDDRLRFSMDVPEGFKDFPEGKRTPNQIYVFIRDEGQGGEARTVITVEKLNGTLEKNQPLAVEVIRKHLPAGASAQFTKRNWRGLSLDTIVATIEQNGMRMVVYSTQIPLLPSAIQLGVTGPESRRAEIEKLADTLLASLEGQTNW